MINLCCLKLLNFRYSLVTAIMRKSYRACMLMWKAGFFGQTVAISKSCTLGLRGSGRIPHFSVALGPQCEVPQEQPLGSPSAALLFRIILSALSIFLLLVTPLPHHVFRDLE